MSIKGLEETQQNIKTPEDVSITDKSLKSNPGPSKRVDINVLKSNLKKIESKEFKKNVYILIMFALGFAVIAIYFSL